MITDVIDRHYFTAANGQIAVRSSATSHVIRQLTLPSSSSSSTVVAHKITFLAVHPLNGVVLLCATEEGSLYFWDWADAVLIRVRATPFSLLLVTSLFVQHNTYFLRKTYCMFP